MTFRRPSLLVLALSAALLAPPAFAADSATAPVAGQATSAKAAQLQKLYAEYWEEVLKLNPVQATFQGDARYNDQLPDFGSAEYRQQEHDFTVRWLKTIKDIGSDGLQGQD